VVVPEVEIPEGNENSLFVLVDGQRLPAYQDRAAGNLVPSWPRCQACTKYHPVGSCPLKVAGVERCPLCGIAHYGYARVCPHIKSETMVRMMLETLRNSSEPRYLRDAATKYLRGVKGTLVYAKKKAKEKQDAAATGRTSAQQPESNGQTSMQSHFASSSSMPSMPMRDPSPDDVVEDRLLASFQNAT